MDLDKLEDWIQGRDPAQCGLVLLKLAAMLPDFEQPQDGMAAWHNREHILRVARVHLQQPPLDPSTLLDLRGVPCPINMAKVRVRLEKCPLGTEFDTLLDDGMPIQNVPVGLRALQHEIVERERISSSAWRIRVRKSH